ncbi:hypothetical protein [Sphingomonas alpina]|uniref:ACT domain-containing protein n=1 Tax=Sphingomonas alpina TaxID=653931 RepID=A0A7H0LEH4_9SPHN|nr:hypothetical protein [Sphingomonas alpina]QNQ08077.1 hypothetical protein H3Z74_14990 [Sphingomonas alpina]
MRDLAVVEFRIRALADVQTLLRLVNNFAQRGLTPSDLTARVDGAWLDISIRQPGLDPMGASLIAEKMRATHQVSAVEIRAPWEMVRQ